MTKTTTGAAKLDRLEKYWRDILLALRFFTRLPIPTWEPVENAKPPKLNEAVSAFPIAGLMIGILPALVWFIASQFLSPFLAASLAIFVGTLITGALHEDGLADCADGLGGASEPKRVLEIMRDSTIGTYGAVALFFSFTFRISALTSLNIAQGVAALLIAHTVAKAAMVIAIATAQYVRPSGLGESVRDGVEELELVTALAIAFLTTIIIAVYGADIKAVAAFLLGILAAWGFLQYLKHRLGGYSGDGLGAIEQITQIAIMITLAAVWA